ncbi:LysM peptidoglycan-binding domain-containing protein [Latilactobacillus sakei]|uniref:LysM peptidoglycan-binding domain-containing protein n=1 Tax=Latilactobacillus sakei TaxID=1599 RepID=UPI0020C789CF|nr:LysM domain-containing protein [Latilactobacillus sakei]MCP8855645.1 LysM peptidoglycan-binding domain-containing protein [Latilactobacillus sakei]
MLKDDKKKQDNPTEEKPWESQFDDDRDDKGNLSRVAAKSKEKGNTYFAIILAVLLVLMIAFPIIAYTVHSSRANRPGLEDSKIVVKTADSEKSKSKSTAKKAKEASESQEAAESKAASESKAKADSEAASAKSASESAKAQAASEQAASEQQAAADSASQQAASESAASSSQAEASSSLSSSETAGGTYTLKQGEGLYRAAANNGMSLSELLALNPGLTANSSVAPGTALKVK